MKTTIKTIIAAVSLSIALAACAQTNTTAGTASLYQHASAIGGAR